MPTSAPCVMPGCAAQWAGSGPARTTLRGRRSSVSPLPQPQPQHSRACVCGRRRAGRHGPWPWTWPRRGSLGFGGNDVGLCGKSPSTAILGEGGRVNPPGAGDGRPRRAMPDTLKTTAHVGFRAARRRAILLPVYQANPCEPGTAPDGVADKRTAGANVADIGCGHGASAIVLAQAFPHLSQFSTRCMKWATPSALPATCAAPWPSTAASSTSTSMSHDMWRISGTDARISGGRSGW